MRVGVSRFHHGGALTFADYVAAPEKPGRPLILGPSMVGGPGLLQNNISYFIRC